MMAVSNYMRADPICALAIAERHSSITLVKISTWVSTGIKSTLKMQVMYAGNVVLYYACLHKIISCVFKPLCTLKLSWRRKKRKNLDVKPLGIMYRRKVKSHDLQFLYLSLSMWKLKPPRLILMVHILYIYICTQVLSLGIMSGFTWKTTDITVDLKICILYLFPMYLIFI